MTSQEQYKISTWPTWHIITNNSKVTHLQHYNFCPFDTAADPVQHKQSDNDDDDDDT